MSSFSHRFVMAGVLLLAATTGVRAWQANRPWRDTRQNLLFRTV